MNSRMKDLYDMDVILKHMSIDDHELESAILSTFKRRHMPLPTELPAAFTPAFVDSICVPDVCFLRTISIRLTPCHQSAFY